MEDLREANRIARYKVGNQHKTVAQTLCNIGYLYFSAGELLAAEATFRDALDIYRAVWSSDSERDSCMAQLTDTLCNIGSILNKRKKFSGAITVFKEALDVSTKWEFKLYIHMFCVVLDLASLIHYLFAFNSTASKRCLGPRPSSRDCDSR